MNITASRVRVAVWLRRIELALLLTALVALGWVVHEQVTASRDQADWAEELESQLAANREAPHDGRRAVEAPKRAPKKRAAASPTLGRIEVPRLRLSAMTREGT